MVDTTRTDTGRRTYRGAAEAGSPRLSGLAGVGRETVDDQQVVETERYDTADRRLAAAGMRLAVQRGEGPARWELTLPDGEGTEVLNVPVPPDAPDPAPVLGELDELIRGASRDGEVRPVGRVRTVRTATRLLSDDGRLLALVVHDHVSLATLGSSTEVESWTEAELRPVDAGQVLVDEIADRLAASGLRPGAPAGPAELDRLLRPEPRTRNRGGPEGSAGAALMTYLAAQVDRIAIQDLRVRRGEPNAVHQLRVASRRLRSALQAYRPLLDRERTEPLIDGLRTLGRELAPARDAEVLRERITAGLDELDPELVLGPVRAQVTRHFARVEAEANAAVLTELDSTRNMELRRALDELLEHPPLRRDRAARKAGKELPRIVARTARRLERAVSTATGEGVPGHERDAAVHEARKAGKRLRYATEVARPAVGKRAKRFAKGLKALQSALGEHQDTVVSRGALRELGARAHASGENGFSFGLLFGRDAARAERIEDRLPGLWAFAWRPKHRRWLPS